MYCKSSLKPFGVTKYEKALMGLGASKDISKQSRGNKNNDNIYNLYLRHVKKYR